MSAITHDAELRLGATRQRLDGFDELTITHDLLAPGSPTTVSLWRPPTDRPWPESALYQLAKVYSPVEFAIDGALQVRGVVERVAVGADHGGATLRLSFRDLTGAAQVADADPHLSLRSETLAGALQKLYQPLGIHVTVGADADEARSTLVGQRPGARARTSYSAELRRARREAASNVGPVGSDPEEVARARTGRSRRQHVDKFRIQPGQKVQAVADALCRRHGYLLFSAPYGDGVGLVIDRPATSPVLYQLTRKRQPDGSVRGNLLAGERTLDAMALPTEVTVFGHSPTTEREDIYHQSAVQNDVLAHPRVESVYLPRPRYLRDAHATKPQIAAQRARRELADANAGFDVYTATVQGWTQGSPGRGPWLYAVNTLAQLDDDETGTRGDWLITQVMFRRSRKDGTLTQMRLVPKGALQLYPDESP